MTRAKTYLLVAANTLLLLTLAPRLQAESWFSRLITGATSSETVSAGGTYAKQCGSCHIAYRPQLLPAVSWERVMSGSNDHFGVRVEITPKQAAAIRNYLLDNGAGRAPDPLAARIMEAQGTTQWPLRLTQMVYFRQRHSQESSTELYRCEQCHPRAAEGDYGTNP
ncbi:MAG: hypothetical protein KDI68_09530 [Gammaproteobacteria bacterium]|nr:hypothetical protein [Gammaproteobacteria bacterium]